MRIVEIQAPAHPEQIGLHLQSGTQAVVVIGGLQGGEAIHFNVLSYRSELSEQLQLIFLSAHLHCEDRGYVLYGYAHLYVEGIDLPGMRALLRQQLGGVEIVQVLR